MSSANKHTASYEPALAKCTVSSSGLIYPLLCPREAAFTADSKAL